MHRTSGNNELCFESIEQALERDPETYGHPDLIAFGFPCQDISGANPKGKGIAGERSGIFFECMRIVRLFAPTWILIENVPRLLSINGGRDMGIVLQTISESGYGYAWRILDSQYFGLAQRRKRIFIVGHLGGFCPPEILFEQKSSGGNGAEKREMWERGVCISAREGERQDPTAETYILNTITSKSYGDKGWSLRNEWNTVVAQTIGSTPRGNSSFVWQDTHIAEINSDRKGEVTGIPDKFHTARGIVIGNAVSVPVAQWIGERIMKYEVAMAERRLGPIENQGRLI